MFPNIKTPDGTISVLVNFQPFSFNSSHPKYKDLLNCVEIGDEINFHKMFNVSEAITQAFQTKTGNNRIEVKNGQVYYNNNVVNNLICEKILEATANKKNCSSLINFLENLMQNPSSNSVNELYKFLTHKGLPITQDGCFIAWKSVRADYNDKYSNKISNKVGEIVSIARNSVDDNFQNHCSHGLHVGALSYAGPGGWYNGEGDKVVAVKVNPADAVSVPNDHSFTKLRVCKYEVVGEFKAIPANSFLDKNDITNPTDSITSELYDDEDYVEYDEEDGCDYCKCPDCQCYYNEDINTNFYGAIIGDVVSFDYVKQSETTNRRVTIQEFITDDGEITHIIAQENGLIKSFKTDRIKLSTFEVKD